LRLQMAGGHQHEAGEGIRLVFEPVVIGLVHFPLELLPLVQGAELELGVNIPVHVKVPEFMRECEAITVQPPLKDELVHRDAGQIAGDETIDLQKVAQSGQGDDVEAAFDLGDLFDGGRNRALRMKFAQELLGYSADFVVREAADGDSNRIAPCGSFPRFDRGSPA
jgi:hypothetical protein